MKKNLFKEIKCYFEQINIEDIYEKENIDEEYLSFLLEQVEEYNDDAISYSIYLIEKYIETDRKKVIELYQLGAEIAELKNDLKEAADYYYEIATEYELMKDEDSAIKYYIKSSEFNKDAILRLANLYYYKDRDANDNQHFKECYALYEKAYSLKDDENSKEVRRRFGMFLLHNIETKRFLEVCEEGVREKDYFMYILLYKYYSTDRYKHKDEEKSEYYLKLCEEHINDLS